METTELPINEAELTMIRQAVEDSPELFGDGSNEEVAVARMETLQLHAIRLLEVVDAFMTREGGNLANDLRQVLRERILTQHEGKAALRGNASCLSLSVFVTRAPGSNVAQTGMDFRILVSPT